MSVFGGSNEISWLNRESAQQISELVANIIAITERVTSNSSGSSLDLKECLSWSGETIPKRFPIST